MHLGICIYTQVYKIKHIGVQTVLQNICERMDRFQEWIPAWDSDKMPPVQHIQSWNFLGPKYSTFNCQLYYKNVKMFGNDSNSTTKW